MTDIDDQSPRESRGVLSRLGGWSLLAILGLAGGAFAYLWFGREAMRQQKVMQSVLLLVVTVAVLLLWVVALSGLRARARIALVALAALVAVGAASTLRVRAVSGDLVPILSWRWTEEPGATLAVAAVGESIEPSSAPMAALADYPQYLGPDRNAVWPSDGGTPIDLARDWSADPPRLVWRQPIGAGFAGFAVSGRRAVTQEQRGADEMITCYDVSDGRLLWSHADRTKYGNTMAGTGPRATPTIAGDAVYTVGATGRLNALDLASGRRLWTDDIIASHDARPVEWGFSGSPLVVGDLVVVNPGGRDDRALVAYDRTTGDVAWSSGADSASYSSPMLAELAGRRQIVIVHAEAVSGHDPESGTRLWRYPWSGKTPKVAQPVLLPPSDDGADRLLVSAGYGVGAVALEVRAAPEASASALEIEALWRSRHMKAKFTNVVHRDGHLYGLDDGVLACVGASDGRRVWKGGRYGHGQLILVDDVLLVLAEDGELALVEATPEDYRELTTFAALNDRTWNTPALAGRYLLVRNDREAACYEMPVR